MHRIKVSVHQPDANRRFRVTQTSSDGHVKVAICVPARNEADALPQLFAATSKDAKSGGYYGPDRLGETRGHPQPARIPPQALDRVACKRLWEVSERMTGLPIGPTWDL